MVRRHNKRRYSNHKKEVTRPTYEKIGVEIFSYEHKYTRVYAPVFSNLNGTNHQKVNQRSFRCYGSKDNVSSFIIELDYSVEEVGEYRIDILYENKDANDYVGEIDVSLTSQKKPQLYSNVAQVNEYVNTLTQLNQKLKSVSDSEKSNVENQIKTYSSKLLTTRRIDADDILFDGELNVLKREPVFKNLTDIGQYKLTIELPPNVLYVGTIIRKIKKYVGDNLDSEGTNLMFTEATLSKSGQTKAMEASFEIAYDNSFECDLSPTGLYFDYADEVNIYVKENAEYSNNEMIRRFGGYISTISTDDDRSKLTFNCADRLRDGESKYILDSLVLLDGTASENDMEYYNPISFRNYGQALKYLCDVYEVTLKSNISKNFLVDGEKYSTGLSLKFGTSKDIKDITTNNCQSTPQANFITLQNNSSGVDAQYFNIYNAKDYAQKPVDITDHLTFHMTYGLGDPKTEEKIETTETTSDGTSAGSQKWSKCGVSADGKYLMAIGLPSAGKDSVSGWTKTVFERKCPHCGSTNVIWDWNWGSYSECRGANEGGSVEGHIFCKSCDADYSVQGYEHINGSSYHMTKASSTVKSSKDEAWKLKNGDMEAVAESGVSVSSEDAIGSVAKKVLKYTYRVGGSSSYENMKKTGIGDAWAFSDAIYTELKKLGVSCKVFQYATTTSDNHQTVAYLNAQNQWVDFPYQEYGFDSGLYVSYNRPNLNANGIKNFKGGNSGDVTTSASSSSTTTSTVTIINGYDKDKPAQFYIELVYATEQSWTAKTKRVYLNFTQKAGTDYDIKGMTNYWINNALRQSSINLKDYFADNEHNNKIYLISIRFIAPKLVENQNNDNKDANWYSFDESTQDYASCKFDLYQIIFDDEMALNPTDLQSCGKTVSSMLQEIVTQSGYRVSMIYGLHRKDDIINFSVDNQTKPRFVVKEGDDSNILEWGNITCSPISSLRNMSICVFKNAKGKYEYVTTGSARSIIHYGGQFTLQTVSEQTGSREAYYNARSSKEYNPEFDYTYTVTTPYAPNLQLGDLIETISDYQYLNDIKPLESIQVKYSNTVKPSIQTTLGVGELEPYLRIKEDMQNLRQQSKATTTFSSSATPVQDEDVYIWDR